MGPPKEIFSDPKWVYKMQLDLPSSALFAQKMIDIGIKLKTLPLTIDELADQIVQIAGKEGKKDE